MAPHIFPCQLGMGRRALVKDDERKGQSATQNMVVTSGYTRNMHKHIRGMESRKYDPWTLKEIWISIIKMMRRLLYPDLSIPQECSHIVSCPENIKSMTISPSKFYVLVNCVTVTANTYLVSLNENSILSSKMIYKSIPKVTTASIFPSENQFLS